MGTDGTRSMDGWVVGRWVDRDDRFTILGLQSRYGDKLLRIGVVCPQNGTAVLKGPSKIAFTKHPRKERGWHTLWTARTKINPRQP